MSSLAIIATHPIQYQAPLYEYLARHGLSIHVFFLSDHGLSERYDPEFGQALAWDVPLLDGYSHEFVPNLRRTSAAQHFFGLVNPALTRRILSGDFSAVLVHGYRTLSMLLAGATAKLGKLPLLYRSETSEVATSRVRRVVGPIFRSAISACLSIGSLNDRFYASLGVPQDRRFLVPYAVDNRRFQSAASSMSKEAARRMLGIETSDQVILYAGKLVPWKQPDLLLRAFASATSAGTHLLVVGAGQMREDLERWAQSNVPGRVTFLGFMNQSRIPIAYRSADLFVLPSLHEPWGLVVNEVMNFEVPVLVSDRVGSGPDLVIPGETGGVFDASDEGALADSLAKLLDDPDRLKAMGLQARSRINQWDFALAATGVANALTAVGAR